MARYFFDINEAAGLHRDNYGDEYDTFDAARKQVQKICLDIAIADVNTVDWFQFIVMLRNEENVILYGGIITYQGDMKPCLN